MFNIGDTVVYGAQGVCKIDSIQSKQIGKHTADYYVLKPLYNENTALFVPLQNELLVEKMRDVLTPAQAKELIDKVARIEILKSTDENHKREQYKVILAGGNREELISLIKTIHAEKESRRESNKKLNINDEQTLRKAELLLYNELGFVLGCEPDEIKNIINF